MGVVVVVVLVIIVATILLGIIWDSLDMCSKSCHGNSCTKGCCLCAFRFRTTTRKPEDDHPAN
eukprot:3488647-Amphidinium_carterae.1